jgi:predicted HAD superfamily Cof-like phosphohydrolase
MNDLHPWQSDVRDFHIGLNLATGDYSNPTGLGGDTLQLRIRLLREEWNELKAAVDELDIVETVDALVDIAYIALGSFDVAGVVCRPRFGLLTDTGVYRGFKHFGEPAQRSLRCVVFCVDQALYLMEQHAAQASEFQRWDLLERSMIEIAHCFCALGIDPRPMWSAVHSNNLEKAGGPIVNGKLCKPPGFKPVDLRPLLKAQGVED